MLFDITYAEAVVVVCYLAEDNPLVVLHCRSWDGDDCDNVSYFVFRILYFVFCILCF